MITLPREHLQKYLIDPLSRHGTVQSDQADVLEAEDHLLVIVDVPGVKRNEVDLTYYDDRLTVRFDRHEQPPAGFEEKLRMRPQSREITVEVPADVAVVPEQATATLTEEGTLEIRLPKEQRATDAESGE